MKNIELRHLSYAVALAKELSFSKAAQKLLIAQPHLSRELKKMETELGYALFERSNRKVSLTQQGAIFIGKAKKIIEDMNAVLSPPKDPSHPIEVMYNDINVPLNVYDEFGWLIGGNEAWLKFWKIEDSSASRAFNFFKDPQIPEDVRSNLFHVFRQRKFTVVEDLFFDPKISNLPGIPRHISLIIYPMFDTKKQFRHFVSIHVDKTETVQMRGELARLCGENADLKATLKKLKKGKNK